MGVFIDKAECLVGGGGVLVHCLRGWAMLCTNVWGGGALCHMVGMAGYLFPIQALL